MLQIASTGSIKHVRWALNDSYILVENRDELGSKNQFWYTKSDFVQFRVEAMHELREFMETTGIDRVDEALSKLYQSEAVSSSS